MEECQMCDKKALHLCITCNMYFCEEHRAMHNKSQHIIETLGIILDSDQISEILENISSKIGLSHECKSRIIKETESVINVIKPSPWKP